MAEQTDQQMLAAEARRAAEERDRREEGEWLSQMSDGAQEWVLEAARFSGLTVTAFKDNGGHPPKGM